MPLGATLKANCDSEIDDIYDKCDAVGNKQADYLATNGKYWQGIAWTPSIPADDVAVNTDATVKPSDQTDDWTDAGVTIPSTAKCCIEVHTYDGPLGKGWVVIGTVTESGTTYSRAKGSGPENRDHDWIELPTV